MEKERLSYHDSVQTMVDRIRSDRKTNLWDRYAAQGLGNDPDKRCPFGMGGVRGDLCSNGPCRVDAEKDKRGVCGIKADGMAMRMMVLRNVMGASTYHFIITRNRRCAPFVRRLEGRAPFGWRNRRS